MGRILRVTLNWTGFVGGPGFTNLFFEPVPESDPISFVHVDAAVAKVQAFRDQFITAMPAVVRTVVDPAVAEIDEVNGEIQTYWNATVAASFPGTGTGNYSAASGACVNWSTGGVRNGRRVRGRTFIVPLANNAFSANGSLDDTLLTQWRTAANNLMADGPNVRLVVWHRPSKLLPIDGGAYDVTGASINDKAAVLTSRRD